MTPTLSSYRNMMSIGSTAYGLLDRNQAKRTFFDYLPKYFFHLAARVMTLLGNFQHKVLDSWIAC